MISGKRNKVLKEVYVASEPFLRKMTYWVTQPFSSILLKTESEP